MPATKPGDTVRTKSFLLVDESFGSMFGKGDWSWVTVTPGVVVDRIAVVPSTRRELSGLVS